MSSPRPTKKRKVTQEEKKPDYFSKFLLNGLQKNKAIFDFTDFKSLAKVSCVSTTFGIFAKFEISNRSHKQVSTFVGQTDEKYPGANSSLALSV